MELQSETKQKERYWVSRLSNIVMEQGLGSTVPTLVCDGERHVPVFSDLYLSADISGRIRKICKQNPVNILNFFLHTLNVLRYKYTGNVDLVTRIQLSGSSSDTDDGVMAWFSRYKLNAMEDSRSAITRLGEQTMEDMRYVLQDWDAIIGKLQHNFSSDPDNMTAIGLSYGARETATCGDTELLFCIADHGDRFCLKIMTGRIHVEQMTLAAVLGHWNCVIGACLAAPDGSIGELPYIPLSEMERIEKFTYGPQREYPLYENIIEPFIAAAERWPEAIAVVCEGTRVSYKKLHRDSDKLAGHLVEKLKTKKGDLVGLMMHRSTDMMTALVAILKAGAAFVPIDPSLPADRVSYILEDTGLRILLSQDLYEDKIGSFSGDLLLVDQEKIASLPDRRVEIVKDGRTAAYVIYTSGSTGNPKGAVVRHDGFINVLHWYVNEYNHSTTDRTLVITSHSFDLTIKNLFAPLWTGGVLHLLRHGDFDPVYVNDLIHAEGITIMNCTPFSFYLLVDGDTDPNFSMKLNSLRVLNLGGEAIVAENLRAWIEGEGFNAMFVNSYGCTECSDITSYHNVTDFGTFFEKPVPAGKPIPNTHIYVLNERLQHTPLGFTGELFNAGIGVGNGYWKNPALTESRFLPDPYQAGGTIYSTGDLVRITEEGVIEFAGRKDHQVKIRGFRIEIPEIENRLMQHPDIKKAIVIPRKEERQYTFLAAYIISAASVNPRSLRDFLLSSLPEYMVPTWFVQIDEFPLNKNGKLDRDKLPDPARLVSGADHVLEPTTPVQEKMVKIWQDLFVQDSVGLLDNFFSLGGNSLRAVQLAARIEQAFQVRISIADIFNNPTVRELAALLQSKDEIRAQGEIKTIPLSTYYPLSQVQKRIWIEDQLEEGSNIVYNVQAVEELTFEVDQHLLERSLHVLIQRHESLRTTFHYIDEEPVQQIHADPGLKVNYQVVETKGNYYAEAKRIIGKDALVPFDLGRLPLLRVSLVKLEEKRYCIAVTIHHIICDGWSLNVLLKELREIYHALEQGIQPALAPLAIQYKDYAAWHNQLLASEEIKAQAKYWHSKLSGELPLIEIPFDRPRERDGIPEADWVSCMLSGETLAAMDRVSRTSKVSHFIIFSAVVKILIYKLTNERDVVTGGLSFGRDREILQGQVGMFVNTLVLRDQLFEDDTFLTVLEKVKTTILESYDNKDYPFDRLADELQPNRDRLRKPFFNIMVVHNEFVKEPLDIQGERDRESLLYGNSLLKNDVIFMFTGNKKIRCDIFFDKRLYNRLTMGSLKEQMEKLFGAALTCPDTRLSDLDIKSLKDHLFFDPEDHFLM